MTSRKNFLLILSSGGMMLSWFYACVLFIFATLSHKPVPLLEAATILFGATILTCFHSRRGWHRISVFGLHFGGFLCSSLWLYHRYYKLESTFWRLSWIPEFFVLEREVTGWLAVIFIFLGVWILWFCGVRLWTKATEQETISHRFDLGLGILLGLLLIKFVIVLKGATIPMFHSSTGPLISFMILGLFSMGFVRTRSVSQKEGVAYLKGVGIILSFAFVTLLLGGGLFILFLPQLQSLAEVGTGLPGTVKSGILQVLIPIIDLYRESLNKLGGSQIQAGSSSSAQNAPIENVQSTINFSESSTGLNITAGIVIVILLLLAGFLALVLLKWLFSKTEVKNDKKGIRQILFAYLYSLKQFYLIFRIKILSYLDTSGSVEKYFKLLQRWGRTSGLEYTEFETPKEYGFRLGDRFPQIETEIGTIIHLHDEATYGLASPDSQQLSRARLALRRLRSPLFWFARLKSFWFNNRF